MIIERTLSLSPLPRVMRRESNVSRRAWWTVPGLLLFFTLVFMPVSYDVIKAFMFAAALITVAGGALVRRSIALHRLIVVWAFVFTLTGTSFCLLGVLLDAPGAVESLLIYVVWPVVYVALIAGATQARIERRLLWILVVASIAISLTNLNLVLADRGLMPQLVGDLLGPTSAVDFRIGFSKMRSYNVSSLAFLVPFLTSCLVVYGWRSNPFIPRIWLMAALGFSSTTAFLSGRRATLIASACAPIITICLLSAARISILARVKVMFRLLGTGLLVILTLWILSQVGTVQLNGLVTLFQDGFEVGVNDGASDRLGQADALLAGWAERPFLGHGFGSYTPEIIRNDNKVWAYELQYVLLLFQVGAVGFLIYASGVMWLFGTGVRVIRSGSPVSLDLIPVLTGSACFLIANATNPYLQAYGHLWAVFLPLLFINHWLLQKDRTSRNGHPTT